MPSRVEKIRAVKKDALDGILAEMLEAHDQSRPVNHELLRDKLDTAKAVDLISPLAAEADSQEAEGSSETRGYLAPVEEGIDAPKDEQT
jgi:hypothetical protein